VILTDSGPYDTLGGTGQDRQWGGFLSGDGNAPVMSERPAVGVVGADDGRVADAVRAAGGRPASGPDTAVDDVSAVVAVGEPALLAVARTEPAVPVLPVAAGRGVRSVPHDAVGSAVTALVAGDYRCETHPLVDVTAADRTTTTALCDVMVVSAEPAQISEYVVRAGGETVASFRADGVVVATPAGSPAYAKAAGGPVVPPETGVAAVVPVAPFATNADHWVVELGDLFLGVERDETSVQLVADDRSVGLVGPTDPVWLSRGSTVTVAVVDASRSPFDR